MRGIIFARSKKSFLARNNFREAAVFKIFERIYFCESATLQIFVRIYFRKSKVSKSLKNFPNFPLTFVPTQTKPCTRKVKKSFPIFYVIIFFYISTFDRNTYLKSQKSSVSSKVAKHFYYVVHFPRPTRQNLHRFLSHFHVCLHILRL